MDTKVAQPVWQFDNLSFQTKQADNLFWFLLNNFIQQLVGTKDMLWYQTTGKVAEPVWQIVIKLKKLILFDSNL